ncbi:DUF2911 domain-containing protein [Gaopeijia maritima]|uniref:DUF2911 domain-containing protein n=1 Tax=Gaopeijia maritima TaxID=3119007 RepID=A0ABU9EBY2_9BACT
MSPGGLATRGLLALVAAVATVPAPAEAQIRASEPSTLTQTIDGTVFRIDYFRPRTRGRAPLFGVDAVVWEHVWTPGANWATRLSVSKPVRIADREVPSGTWSVWIEMDEAMMPHEIILEPDTLIFHTNPPERADDQLRWPVTMTDDAPFRELLTWDFEDIHSRGGTLALRWGTHRIALDVEVEPSMVVTTTPEQAAMALGTFEARFVGEEGESPPFTVTFSRSDDGILHADFEGVPGRDGGEDEWFNGLDMWMIPTEGEGWFLPGEAYDGVLWETWAGNFFEFDLTAEGPSGSFVLRDEFDEPFMRGTRIR